MISFRLLKVSGSDSTNEVQSSESYVIKILETHLNWA